VSRPADAESSVTTCCGPSGTAAVTQGTSRGMATTFLGTVPGGTRSGLEGSGWPLAVGSQASIRSARGSASDKAGSERSSAAARASAAQS
jgi:hypothetical protein